MTAVLLLAQASQEIPELAIFPWQVHGHTARAFASLHPGRAYDARRLFDLLRGAGWRRSGTSYYGTGTWLLEAALDREDAGLRLEGMTSVPPASGNLSAPYFAPPVPPLGRSRGSLAAFREWESKVREGTW